MKSNQILAALEIAKPTASQKQHARTLAAIYAMIAEMIGQIVSVCIVPAIINFGREGSYNYRTQKWEFTNEGEQMPGEKWTIKTQTGNYSVTLPTGNEFYNLFRQMLQKFVPIEMINTVAPSLAFILDYSAIKELKKALPFLALKDELRTNLHNVLFRSRKGQGLQFIASDGSRLFRSEFLTGPLFYEFQNFDLPIPGQAIKAALTGAKEVKFEFFGNGNTINAMDGYTHFTINGIRYSYDVSPFPAFESIWPKYGQSFEVYRHDLIQAVKSVLPATNKHTNSLRFSLNGSLCVAAEDLDFSHEGNVKIRTIKNGLNTEKENFDFGLNGKFLLDCLATSKANTVKIYTEGKANKCFILDETCLIMPVLLNQYI